MDPAPVIEFVPGDVFIQVDGVRVQCRAAISQAEWWPEKDALVLLVRGTMDRFPSDLVVMKRGGELVASFAPPAGFGFYYLTMHWQHGVLVVCGASERVDRWMDWHFRIDLDAGRLERTSPAK